jgi:hypothetical protein
LNIVFVFVFYGSEPRCRNADARLKQLNVGRNIDAGLIFSGIPALHMLFQHSIARISPSAAIYGRAGCIFSRYLQFGRAGCIPFHSQQYGRAGCLLPAIWTFMVYNKKHLNGMPYREQNRTLACFTASQYTTNQATLPL